MNSIIKIENLSKRYWISHKKGAGYNTLREDLAEAFKKPTNWLNGNKAEKEHIWALKDINFSVEPGEIVGIIGPNGAGKSTLLKILTRITPPSEGRVIVSGRIGSLLEVGTGFHPELTGRENIYLNGAILGMKKKEIDRKFDEIVEFSGVGKFLDTPIKRYSSGMNVRLAFSVAAHLELEILLIDEVLAVGDAEFQKKCMGKMEDITSNKGRTIIFVSHNMSAIQNLCGRCALIERGQIVSIGKTDKIVEEYLNSKTVLSSIPLKNRKDRKGTGQVRITNVELLNENFTKITSLATGEPAIIAIDYESQEQEMPDNIDFGISLRDRNGEPLSLLTTSYVHKCFDHLEPAGRVYCSIPKLPLTAGVYYANVDLSIFDDMVDWVFDAVTIEVVGGDFYEKDSAILGGHGPFLIEHKWEKEKAIK